MKTFNGYVQQFTSEYSRGLISYGEYERAMDLLNSGFYTTLEEGGFVEA